MRVKRYVAESIPEAIAQVKSDLGRNAIILHTKPFKEGGFLGLFCKRRFEVIAAIDENPGDYESTRDEKRAEVANQPYSKQGQPVNLPAAAAPQPTPVPAALPLPTVSSPPPAPHSFLETVNTLSSRFPGEIAAGSEPELNTIKEELAQVKELIRQVVSTAKTEDKPVAKIEPLPVVHLVSRPESPDLREKWLKAFNLEDALVQHLIATANQSGIASDDQNSFLGHCQQVICRGLTCEELIPPAPVSLPQVVTLIGPTGVGKTTTIAKLAANFNLFEGKKVGLVTIDTYRIAAVEHLKTYGEIINLPVEVVYNQKDLENSLVKFKDFDLILVDTAGRSPHNQPMMEELRQFLNNPALRLIQLVISATTQYQDMVGIVDNFAVIPYSHFIFTKLDETSCLGPVISLAWKTGRPISYLTTGQNVPDDIELAKPERIVERLFKGIQHG